MPEVHRYGDPNTAGAPIVRVAQNTVFVNNLLLSVDGSDVAGHGPGEHAGPITANGSITVFAEFIPVNDRGDPDSCGHPRDQGSPDVYTHEGGGGGGGATVIPAQLPEGVRVVEGRTIYDNTPAGHTELTKAERAVSPSLPTYHEEKPGDAPPAQTDPAPQPSPPEGCKNSKYYNLLDSKMEIKAQNGLTKEQIECNWIALCTNILDPLRDAGFNFKINSAFRTTEYNASIGSSNASDHTIGCAADISLGSQESNKKMFKALLNNYPYSQLIFEGNWVHVAYNGRGPKGGAKVMYTYTGKSPQVAGADGSGLPSDLRTA
jgi:hypothetical protein